MTKKNRVYDEVRERDVYCRACGGNDILEVHHIKFRSQGGPDEAWNLITLCKSCHGAAHGLSEPRLERDYLHAIIERNVRSAAGLQSLLLGGAFGFDGD